MPESLWSIVCFASCFGLVFLVGWGTLTLTRLPMDGEDFESALMPLAVGMGVTGYIVLLVGLLGGLVTPFFWLLFIAGCVPAFLLLFVFLTTLFERRKREKPKRRIAEEVGIAFFWLLALFTVIGALAPPVGLEWDSLSYHLANLKTWLRDGRIFYLPWDHHSNFPFTIQMLYLWMLGMGSVGGAKLVHWFCGVLLVVSVYTFGRRYLNKTAGIIAASLVAATPIVLWEATVAYIDLATALYTWLSFYAFWNGIHADKDDAKTGRAWRILSAVLMGFALGTKYTVLGFWGMGLVAVLYERRQATRRLAPTLAAATLWGGIGLIIALPWYLKTTIYTGNPVYPFAYSIFGGKFWSKENADLYAGAQSQFGLGKDLTHLLLSPWQVTNEPLYLLAERRPFIFTEYITSGFGLSPAFVGLLLMLPLASLLGVRLSKVSKICLVFGLGVFAFWFFLMQQTRYLIPALPFFAIPMAEMVVGLWERKAISRWFAGGIVAASALWGVYVAGGIAFWGVQGPLAEAPPLKPVAPVVFGGMSRDEYITRRFRSGGASLWINANTDKNAKVALFDETQGFYLDRDYVWAQPNHAAGLIPWDSYATADDWLNDFRAKGYTILLIASLPAGTPDDGQKWRGLFAEALASGKVKLAFEQAGAQVYLIQ